MTIMVPILDITELNLMVLEEESCDEIHITLVNVRYTSIWWYFRVLPVLHRPDVIDIDVNTI